MWSFTSGSPQQMIFASGCLQVKLLLMATFSNSFWVCLPEKKVLFADDHLQKSSDVETKRNIFIVFDDTSCSKYSAVNFVIKETDKLILRFKWNFTNWSYLVLTRIGYSLFSFRILVLDLIQCNCEIFCWNIFCSLFLVWICDGHSIFFYSFHCTWISSDNKNIFLSLILVVDILYRIVFH